MDEENEDLDQITDQAFNEATGVSAPPVSEPPVEDTTPPEGEGETTPLAGEGEGEGETTSPADEGEGETTPPAGEGEGEGETTPPAGEGDTTPPAAGKPKAPVTPESAPQPAIDPKFLAQAIVEANNKMAQEKAAQQPPADAPPAYVPKTAEDFLSKEQKAAVKYLNDEWSELAPAVSALIEASNQALRENMQHEFNQQFSQTLAPIQQSVAQSQEAALVATFRQNHPDVDQVLEALPEWIEKQPALNRNVYQQVFEKGSLDELSQLFEVYKATGQTSAAPTKPASPAAPVKTKAPVPKAALAATAPAPASKRSSISTSRDSQDPDSAWEEATAS